MLIIILIRLIFMDSKFLSGYLDQEKFELKFNRKSHPAAELCNVEKLKTKFAPKNIFNSFYSLFPIIKWLQNYNWKRNLPGDIIGGFTVGIMQVPQGMAYASLASLPPVYGMYSSFFASTVYMFFGTSRHISIGVFAVASLMVGAVRLRLLPDPDVINEIINGTKVEVLSPPNGAIDFGYPVTPVMLTSALAMTVGLIQLCMAALRLSFLTTYMSDALIAGFTTGSAFHVLIAQLNKVIGVKLPRYTGFGMLFFMLRDLFLALPQTNYFSLGLSLFSIAFLSIGRDYVNPWFKKKLPVPLPFELILVIITTIFSVILNLESNYDVKIVNYIPQGIPHPSLPKFSLIPYLINDALAIAIISYMFVISMGKLFAKKRRYKIDATQELYAVGMMHTLSSFFPVFPNGASLSRSAVCEQSGANTQLYIFFSNALLLIVIAFIGPLLEPLPMCILASIVIVSLKSLFLQFRELPKLWQISKFDFSVWLVCCIATLSNNVMTGLTISIVFTLITIVLQEQWPNTFYLGRTLNGQIYKPIIYYDGLTPVRNDIRIIRFEAPLNFVNVSVFLTKMNAVLLDDIEEENENIIISIEDTKNKISEKLEYSYAELAQKDDALTSESIANKKTAEIINFKLHAVILDCSGMTSIDTMGIEAIKEIYNDAQQLNIKFCFANISETILDTFDRIRFFDSVPKSTFFPSIEEAVLAVTK